MDQTVTPLAARRSPGRCRGRVRVPGDKSISHRALILGALTVGETRITGPARRRGRHQHRQGDARARARPSSAPGRAPGACTASASRASPQPAEPLDFGNSGTGCRLVIGRGRGLPDHRDLRRRCLAALAPACGACSIRWSGWARGRSSIADGGRLPLTLQGARDPIPIVYAAAGRLRAAQVRGAARGACGAGRDRGGREPRRRATTPSACCAISAPTCGSSTKARMAAASRSRASRSSCRRPWWFRPIRRPPRSRWSPR